MGTKLRNGKPDSKNKDNASEIIISNNTEILETVMKGRGPKHMMLAFGMVAWEPGQLEDEIKNNLWISCPVKEDLIFGNQGNHQKWLDVGSMLGVNMHQMVSVAGHA